MFSGFHFKTQCRTSPCRGDGGFTLLEISIVIAIMAVVMMGGAVLFSAYLQRREADETTYKLQTLQTALLEYRRTHNRLPCPADITQSNVTQYYGVEASNPGTCMGGATQANYFAGASSSSTPSVSMVLSSNIVTFSGGFTDAGIEVGSMVICRIDQLGGSCGTILPYVMTVTSIIDSTHLTVNQGPNSIIAWSAAGQFLLFTSGATVSGMVPTKTLNLDDEFAVDGWGRRIMYAVDPSVTAPNAFVSIPMSDTTPRLTVNDPAGQPRTTMATYVLTSFGPDGHGAYPRNGGTARVNAGSINSDQLINCHCNSDGTDGTFSGTFVQRIATEDPTNLTHTNDFDDIVVYATRRDLRALTE